MRPLYIPEESSISHLDRRKKIRETPFLQVRIKIKGTQKKMQEERGGDAKKKMLGERGEDTKKKTEGAGKSGGMKSKREKDA